MGMNISRRVESILRRLTRRRSFPLVVRRFGATFILDPRNWIDCEIAMRHPYEEQQIDRARTVIQNENLNTFIDVGANLGLYTVLLGQISTVRRVVAFEPVRRNYAQLLANVFANKIEMKVETYRIALGDQSGRQPFMSIPGRRQSHVSCLRLKVVIHWILLIKRSLRSRHWTKSLRWKAREFLLKLMLKDTPPRLFVACAICSHKTRSSCR